MRGGIEKLVREDRPKSTPGGGKMAYFKRMATSQFYQNHPHLLPIGKLITIILALIAIGVVYFYSTCQTTCSSLRGSIFGIELQYIGIVYMAAIIVLAILKKDKYLLMLLSAGVGSEIYLIGFQIGHHTYCPYCIAFGTVVIAQFIVNMVLNMALKKTLKKTFKMTLLVFLPMVIAFVLFLVFFEGTTATFRYTF